ncbi:MAG TPA: response regulator transcription factor [Gemmatimonadaceae bacterium]|nr:response regulator transcription factor [Gemmatimonadaceae bacterium]
MSRILVVEDERNLALGLRANLEVEGYEVTVAENGEAALEAASARSHNLIILDLMLPGIDGYEVLSTLRARGVDTSVLILSARAEEIDKVRGFRAGADDYVTKPFGVMELLLRVQALLRRSSVAPGPAKEVWNIGNVEIDATERLIRRNGAEIAVTPRAFELLVAMLSNAGKTLTRHDLLRSVWGYDGSVTTRTVDAHVAELRRKLEENPAEPRYILTVHKVGYRLKL